ncbi:hypothetical protein JCM11641_006890 [Rhodosporidiobolus odoratus]
MPPRAIPASFWRGGTSRGLLFRAETLAAYPRAVRDRIILTALGSPDPAGRQISGLDGGVSSLSKAAIVSVPGEGKDLQDACGKLPGVSWADDGERDGVGKWDLVYRFAQVGVKKPELDWTASCGNMFAAAALQAVSVPLVPYTTLFTRSRTLPQSDDYKPIMFPLSILSASNGVLMRARVPLDPITLHPWEPAPGEGVGIAGVPGKEESGIEVEMPLEVTGGIARSGLVTGRPTDTVKLENGREITVSLLTSGLPNIFVPLSSLLALDPSLPPNLLTLSSHQLTSIPHLSSLLETIRTSTAAQHNLPCSLATPKIVLVGEVPSEGYTTSSGDRVGRENADLLVRAVSSGDWHATIPGTTLGALNVGMGTPGTVVRSLCAPTPKPSPAPANITAGAGQEEERVVTIRAAHAAGVAESSVRFEAGGKPQSVVMVRTAREIMRGEVLVPERVFWEGQ